MLLGNFDTPLHSAKPDQLLLKIIKTLSKSREIFYSIKENMRNRHTQSKLVYAKVYSNAHAPHEFECN